MARRKKYGRNPEKYNLREISILLKHHIEDVYKGLKKGSVEIAKFSIEDAYELLEEQKPPAEYLERVWPELARAKLAILSYIHGLED